MDVYPLRTGVLLSVVSLLTFYSILQFNVGSTRRDKVVKEQTRARLVHFGPSYFGLPFVLWPHATLLSLYLHRSPPSLFLSRLRFTPLLSRSLLYVDVYPLSLNIADNDCLSMTIAYCCHRVLWEQG